MIGCFASINSLSIPQASTLHQAPPPLSSSPFPKASPPYPSLPLPPPPLARTTTRRAISVSIITLTSLVPAYPSKSTDFLDITDSGGVKALDLRIGTGEIPVTGDQVELHYIGRLAAKQGWRFDSTYDHKDNNGEPLPFVFTLGSGNVISGIESGVRSMKVGGIRRIVIPPSQGYQNTSQEPLPPNFFDRQRLFTTIFNPTRLANGEGSTLGTLVFDIQLVSLRHRLP